MDQDKNESLIDFPCDFPLKVMGKDSDHFHKTAYELVQRHVGDLDPNEISKRRSSGGKFVALTFRFQAQSREQLDALYQELNSNEHVLMVL